MKLQSRLQRRAAMAALGVAAAAIAGCSDQRAGDMTSYSNQQSKSSTPELFTIPQDQMSHVKIVTIEPGKLTHTLRLTGAVAYNAFNTTSVITQVGGPVSRILVVPGEKVQKGQTLLEISSPDYSLLLATYVKAKDAYRVADKNFDRAKDLYAHDAVAERDLLQAESDRNQAKADVYSSEQGLRVLGITNIDELAKSPAGAEIRVPAPISGEVVERLVSPGQVLQAGATQAFTISDMSTVWVLVNVYQADLAFVKAGDDVAVTTDAYPDTFHGKISYISPSLDPNTRTLQARLVVQNPAEKLKKDMYVTAVVYAGTTANALSVPDAAVLRNDENMPFVYVEQSSNQFGRRPVEIGESVGGQTQVLKGLSPGQKVVGDGALFLQFANSLQH